MARILYAGGAMYVRIVLAALLTLGALPFQVCTCAAEHAALSTVSPDGTEPEPTHHEHDPDCPIAKAANPNPALNEARASIDPDDPVAMLALVPPDLAARCETIFDTQTPDSIRPIWLVHLALQI
jgi:hypothetical protein